MHITKKYSLASIALMVVKLFQGNNQFWWALGSWLKFDSMCGSTRDHMGTQFWFYSTNRIASWLDFDSTSECYREHTEKDFWFSSTVPNSNFRYQVLLKYRLMRPTAIVGSCGRNHIHGHNYSRFCPSWIFIVCFLCKSTDFHDMRTECQRIIIHFLLIISHKLLVIAR